AGGDRLRGDLAVVLVDPGAADPCRQVALAGTLQQLLLGLPLGVGELDHAGDGRGLAGVGDFDSHGSSRWPRGKQDGSWVRPATPVGSGGGPKLGSGCQAAARRASRSRSRSSGVGGTGSPRWM